MKYKLQGEVLKIGEVQEFNNDFRKRELVVETTDNPEYSNPVPVEFIKDKCELLNSISVGQEVEVEFFLSGRAGSGQYSDRTFLNLRGFNFSFVNNVQDTAKVTDGMANAANNAASSAESAENDSIPF